MNLAKQTSDLPSNGERDTLPPFQTVAVLLPHSCFYFCPPAIQLLSPRAVRSITHSDVLAPALISAARRCPEMPIGSFGGDFQHLSSIPPTALHNESTKLVLRCCFFPPLLLLFPSVSSSTADRLPTSDPSLSAPCPLSSYASGPNPLLPSSRLT